jgi:hypothetical protein
VIAASFIFMSGTGVSGWEGGDDKQYSALIPVQTAEEIAALKKATIFELLRYYPRLQWEGDLPTWIGKH